MTTVVSSDRDNMAIVCPNCHSHDVALEPMQVGAPITCKCRICEEVFPLYDGFPEYEDGETIEIKNDPVNAPSHYIGKIECIDYLRDKLTKEEFTGFCMGNVLKYSSRWRKKDGLQDLKKAKVYLEWAIDNEEKSNE